MGSPKRPRAKPIEGHIALRKAWRMLFKLPIYSGENHYTIKSICFRHNVRNQLTRLYFTRKFDQEVNAFVIEELTA